MALLADLGDYLSTGIGSLVVGQTLFLGRMPAVPVSATAIYETGGQATVHAMNSGPGQAVMERPRVQVVTRSTGGYAAARTVMQSIFVRLDGTRDVTLNSTLYHWIASVQSPFLLQIDENDHALMACNFDVHKRMG